MSAAAKSHSAADTEILDQLIEAALPDAGRHGWRMETMEAAADSVGVDRLTLHRLFPDGLGDVLVAFASWADRQMVIRYQEVEDLDEWGTTAKVRFGVLARLEALAPHKDAVRSSARLLAMPQHAAKAPGIVWRTADLIWYTAGDRSTDFNYYSKRSLLVGVLLSTLAFWMRDSSPEAERTHDFLDRRLENVLTVGKAIGQVKGTAEKVAAALPLGWGLEMARRFYARRFPDDGSLDPHGGEAKDTETSTAAGGPAPAASTSTTEPGNDNTDQDQPDTQDLPQGQTLAEDEVAQQDGGDRLDQQTDAAEGAGQIGQSEGDKPLPQGVTEDTQGQQDEQGVEADRPEDRLPEDDSGPKV